METAPLIQGKDINKYIPQRDPIVLVDTLYECSGQTATTGLSVSQIDPMFIESGRILESGLIEHMAQSCALQAGYAPQLNGSKKPKEPAVCFIAEVKNLRVVRRSTIEESLVTKVEIVTEVMGIQVIQWSTKAEAGDVCRCEMKIFLKPDQA